MLTRAKASTGETLLVKITSIRRDAFRGELADSPSSACRLKLRLGSPVAFTTGHLHSLPKGRTTTVTSDTTRAVPPQEKKAKPKGSATLKIKKCVAKKFTPRECVGWRVETVGLPRSDLSGKYVCCEQTFADAFIQKKPR
jgi:hypothetical protein